MTTTTTRFLRYSKQLTKIPTHLVFFILSLGEVVSLFLFDSTIPLLRYVFLPLLPFYFVGGTVIWNYVQRSGRYQRAYFVVMTILVCTLMIIASIAVEGVAGILMLMPIALQGGTLPRLARRLFLSIIMLFIILSAVLTGETQSFNIASVVVILSSMSAVLTFDFLGRVIVSEEEARRQLAKYATEVEELSVMRERNRLAREIHDNLGHYLTAINMQAQAAQAILSNNPQQADEALTHIRALAREGLQEVRKSIASLRAFPMENSSLHEAITALIEDNRLNNVKIDFQQQGEAFPASPELEITLYRVVQEALTNVRKHAQAQHVEINLRYQTAPALVTLHIHDDGQGAQETQHGFGLLGLEERVRLLGGTFRTHSEVGGGFHIEVEITL